MEQIILKNGNIAVVTNVRWTWDRCLFTCILYDKNGFWNHQIQEEYHIGYYNSVKDYLTTWY